MEDPILLMMIILLVIVKIALTDYYGHKINYFNCPKSSESNIVFFVLIIFISGDLDPTAAEQFLQHRGLVLNHLPEAGILGGGHALWVIADDLSIHISEDDLALTLSDLLAHARYLDLSVDGGHRVDGDRDGVGNHNLGSGANVRHPRVRHLSLLHGGGDNVNISTLRIIGGGEANPTETSIALETITQWNVPRGRAGGRRAPISLGTVLDSKTLIGYEAWSGPAEAGSPEQDHCQNRFRLSIYSSHNNLPGWNSRHHLRLLSQGIKLNQTRAGRNTGGKMARRRIGPILANLGAGHGCGRVCTPLDQPGAVKVEHSYLEGGRHDEITKGDGLARSFQNGENVAGKVTI